MTVKELYKIADEIASKRISDEYCQKYGAYDNSGILVDTGLAVNKALFSLDLSQAAVKKAIEEKANVIITHHPAIYGKIDGICVEDPLGKKLIDCIKNGISVISMHLNLDAVKGGIDESLQEAVCIASHTKTTSTTEIMHSVAGGGYGRAYDINATPLQTLCDNLGKELQSKRAFFYGNADKKITRVASFCGAGVDGETLAFAKAQGVDVMISADYKHHFIAQALELGISVIVLTHYATETYGFEKYYEKIRQQTDIPCIYHADEELF